MDIAKLAMAIVVVLIHRPLVKDGLLRFLMSDNSMLSVAVPFFFVTSSFLFFRKLRQPGIEPKKALVRFEKRLLLLYITYSAVFFPVDFLKTYCGELAQMTFRTFAAFVVQYARISLLDASFIHLWYINTLMLTVFAVYLLTRTVENKTAVLCIAAAEFLLMCLLFLFNPDWTAPIPKLLTNTIRIGFPCVCAGYFAAQCSDNVRRIEMLMFPLFWLLLLGSSILSYPNQTVIWKCVRMFFAYITAFSILRFCIAIPLRSSPVYKTVRAYSTLIYFLHLLLFSELLSFVAAHTGIYALTEPGLLRFSLTLGLAVIEASCILLLQKKKAFRFLRYLY
ncbi:MAG: acyltransferase family protein [Clostridia bacterium]|nr:acyltransferase family protein [Clostridia bacterium]